MQVSPMKGRAMWSMSLVETFLSVLLFSCALIVKEGIMLTQLVNSLERWRDTQMSHV